MKILVDSLEQQPLDFIHPVRQVRFSPPDTGDYSIEGLVDKLRVERKKPEELWGCCGHRRDHFRDQLKRLQKFPYRLLIVEGSVSDLAHVKPSGQSRMTWPQVCSHLMRWTAEFGVPVWFLGPRSPETCLLFENLLIALHEHYTRLCSLPTRWRPLWVDPIVPSK